MEYIPFVATMAFVALATTAVINPKLALRIVMHTIAFAAAVIAVALLLCLHGVARAHETPLNTDDIYVRVGIIDEIDEENVAHIRDGAKVEWLWEKEESDELEEGDIVGLLVQKSGNPDSIFDDTILKVYYGGII